MSGFSRGFSAATSAAGETRMGRAPFAFFIEPGKRRKFCFLDEEPFNRKRHFVKVSGEFQDITCIEAPGVECPICDVVGDGEPVSVLTVLDLEPWKDRENRTHYVTRKAFVMTRPSVETFGNFAQKKNGLRGWIVEGYRAKKQDPRVGVSHDFEERIEPEKFVEVFGKFVSAFLAENMTAEQYLSPLDYEKLYAPPTVDQARRIARRLTISRGGGGGRGARAEEPEAPPWTNGHGAPPPTDEDAPGWVK